MKKKILSILFCTLLITIVSASAVNIKQSNEEEKLSLVRINISQNLELINFDLDIVGQSSDRYIDIIFSEDELSDIIKLDIEYEIIIDDLIEHDNSVRGTYHTLAQMEDILEDINDNYPDITDLYSIGTTYEDRDIWCLEISDNPGVDEGEPGVFFMGLHHAREWPTVEICLHIADQLTSEYGSNSDITDAVNNNRIWLVTCVNPDGYYYCHDQGHDWRKNRRPEGGSIGIDLNRNYAGSSDGDPWGAWGSVGTGSISNNPSSEVYCGPSPFSEAETQSVRDIFLENDIHATISWHTHGELVMWPWGYTHDNCPDNSYISQVGQQIAQEITKQSGYGNYNPTQSAGLYPTTGDTTDWAYGFEHFVKGTQTFAYTIEACSTFHPTQGYLDQIVSENFDGAMILLQEAQDIKDTVVPRVISDIEEMDTDIDGDYQVSWEILNIDSDPIKYQLDELIGPDFDTDDSESGTDYWDIEGFTQSTSRYHSSSHSYKSGSGNEKVFYMTTVDPIPIETGMELDFWCWYNIEDNWDMGFVEVSTNGRSYDLIDSFTGISSDWEHKTYSLDEYSGQSIFIRFRYITDQNTLEEGIYFDDIYPVVEWNSITTISDSITNDYYDITDKSDGTYYYRVKGFNSEHDWCDFSSLEPIVVEIFENDPPSKPTINGPTKGETGKEYDYKIISTDPDGDDVYYYLDWGDGDITEWVGPYLSGEEVTVSHIWNEKGNYIIKVKSKDIYDAESQFSSLNINIPRYRSRIFSLIENFPFMQKIIQLLIQKI